MPTVAVFFGGRSNESEVSVITGMLVCNLLRGGSYRVLPVYLPPEGGMVTADFRAVEEVVRPKKPPLPVRVEGGTLVRAKGRGRVVARFDVALNCCHGGMGEDGTLSALLAWHGVPLASPAMPESAVFMDKWLTKIAARGLDISVAPAVCLKEGEDGAAKAEEVGYPLVVKPVHLGSSIGVTVVHAPEELDAALALAFELDDAALLEKYFEGRRDINCAAARIGGEVRLSQPEEVFSAGDVLTYREKYEEGRGSQCPADLSEEIALRIRAATHTLYEAFGMRGIVRADFLVVGEEVFFNELNMVPGSLAGYLLGGTLSGTRRLLEEVIADALARPKAQKHIIHTGILTRGVFSGAKSCKRRQKIV